MGKVSQGLTVSGRKRCWRVQGTESVSDKYMADYLSFPCVEVEILKLANEFLLREGR